MSSAKDIVAGECGSSNPLMKATQHLTKDQTFRSAHPNNSGYGFTGEGMATEFLQGPHVQTVAQPNTFQMDNLLNDINNIQQHPPMRYNSPFPSAASGVQHQWAQEFSGMNHLQNTFEHEMLSLQPPVQWEHRLPTRPFETEQNKQSQWSQEFTSEKLRVNQHEDLLSIFPEVNDDLGQGRMDTLQKHYPHDEASKRADQLTLMKRLRDKLHELKRRRRVVLDHIAGTVNQHEDILSIFPEVNDDLGQGRMDTLQKHNPHVEASKRTHEKHIRDMLRQLKLQRRAVLDHIAGTVNQHDDILSIFPEVNDDLGQGRMDTLQKHNPHVEVSKPTREPLDKIHKLIMGAGANLVLDSLEERISKTAEDLAKLKKETEDDCQRDDQQIRPDPEELEFYNMANRLLNEIETDSKMRNTSFASYVSGIANTPPTISNRLSAEEPSTSTTPNAWAEEFKNDQPSASAAPQSWAGQFTNDSDDRLWMQSTEKENVGARLRRGSWQARKPDITEEGARLNQRFHDTLRGKGNGSTAGVVPKSWAEEFKNDQPSASTTSQPWAEEFQNDQPSASATSQSWMGEFLEKENTKAKSGLEVNWKDEYEDWKKEFDREGLEQDVNMSDSLSRTESVFKEWDNDWKRMAGTREHNWLEEFEAEKSYEFSKDNPFKDMSGAFEEGLKRMKLGDLSNSVLLFEAVVQDNPDHVEAWHQLGQAQAQNEQEEAAIIALNRTLSLNPNNLSAVMALAVSQTNESKQIEAVRTLRKWIVMNPKYAHLTEKLGDATDQGQNYTYFHTIAKDPFYKAVENAFVEAARISPQDPDLDVQCALGILFHISGDFDKAVDCFQAAIQVKPDDALLWNKLGATLANGNRSEEAIQAYRRALELNPGFTRSRYNLGISCINLRANREAVEHFLTALDAQRSARGPTGEIGQMSDSVWNTLRMTLSLMHDNDAYAIAERRDLDALMQRFDVAMMKTKQEKLQ